MWATDASYFRVSGWGYHYMVTVMGDYSRSILAWKLQVDMTADSLIQVVQVAVDITGMTEVPLEDRARLLSDNGSGYVSRAFRDYLDLVGTVTSGRRLTTHKPTGSWSGTIKASRTTWTRSLMKCQVIWRWPSPASWTTTTTAAITKPLAT